MRRKTGQAPVHKVALAGLLAWILPGLGHFYVGQRRRGVILLVVLGVTFWGGVAIGGVQSTVQPRARKAWFMAQMCAGSHAIVTYAWGQNRAKQFPHERASQLAEEIAIVYAGVVGLLNILVILDAMASTDPNYVRVPPEHVLSERGGE